MADKKAAVNFQHAGVWYGPDHGGAPVPAEIAKAVGSHVFGDEPEQAEEDAEQAPAKAPARRSAKD